LYTTKLLKELRLYGKNYALKSQGLYANLHSML
jgi:hypothetical protein